MKEQLAAWNSQTSFPGDTLPAKPRDGNETYQRGYATELDLIGADTKPFLGLLVKDYGGGIDEKNINIIITPCTNYICLYS